MIKTQGAVKPAFQQSFCEAGVLERPRYFPRLLMTPDELTLEQNYFRDRMRRHNRLLHGWGVVCGALVCRVSLQVGNGTDRAGVAPDRKARQPARPCPPVDEGQLDPWNVRITPGYLLGPYGDEIIIDCPVKVDVRHMCTTVMAGEPCPPAPDPWCNDVTVQRRPGQIYVAVRYKEVATRPVRIQPAGCACDEAACEYSRYRDGYEICMLDTCPPSHAGPPPEPEFCLLESCPPCPEDPWVVLARIDLSIEGVTQVDNYSCRRMVPSLANYWCRPATSEPETDDEIQVVEMLKKAARSVAVNNMDLPEEDLVGEEKLQSVGTFKATVLRGITSSSQLGKKLDSEEMTIEKIAAMSSEDFFEFAVQNEPENRRAQIRNQAGEVWRRASEIMEAVDTWKRYRST